MVPLRGEEPIAYRTDEDPDEKLPWFQLVDGEFPPSDASHAISGELIHVDHLRRKFVIRVDRTDAQNRSHFDLPLSATMLPYGSISYHGAPAALEDIPLGTHLHGEFFVKDPDGETAEPFISFHNRVTLEADFTRCLLLEDDFSFHRRQDRLWRVNEVNLEEKELTATLRANGEVIGEPKTFDLLDSTRVWRGSGITSLESLAKDQSIQFSLTWATLYGPGRVREIWIDEESRTLATEQQRRKHHGYTRQRGLPGWIDAVDNRRRILTITFFDSVDPKLFDELKKNDQAGVAVAAESLRTYDPVNDRKRGPILEKSTVPTEPGGSTVRIKVKPDLLLEGYRPGRIVRVFPSAWPVIALPREQELWGQD